MKRKTINPLWLVLATAALLFVLSACERPVPQPEVPTTTAPVVVPTTAPEIIVPTPVPPEPTIAPYPGPGEIPVDATAVPEGGETIPQATPVVDPTGPQSHTVQAGETLFSISQRYNVPAAEIAAANNLANVNQLDVGQVLVIPVAGSTPPTGTTPPTTGEQVHIVQPGENLFRIALRYGMTTNELAAYNGIADPTLIFVGQVIRIPAR
ncbi:MAG: LysM peptidoglycan-binding domain-containing protein [Chloroflexi bacterium]|nr:LysM peptidoglycan-binding domain-containing protein [Chloroflexota bacterium]MBP7044345.1 LysM peptidoglycan-binding domain-containing protein [Chloroflexota bacterium]